ncbi:hypothetical protein PGT21_031758 [Puccinia graminis f. sp. tritici]|uniref:Uncharacterized protein n=1 Tax=Puccinia graminis f. sp. tritici TaxID=56615 RepID=A0A5B0M8X5_PUCGR|nr:hypothetical protein PGT21_031758 [Puccinia graminis f. sp. tritici]
MSDSNSFCRYPTSGSIITSTQAEAPASERFQVLYWYQSSLRRPHYQSAGLTTAPCLFITNTQSSSLRIAAKYQKESSSRQRCTLMSWDVFNEPSRPLTNYHVKPVEVDIESGQIWPYIPHSSQIRSQLWPNTQAYNMPNNCDVLHSHTFVTRSCVELSIASERAQHKSSFLAMLDKSELEYSK